MAGVSVQMGVSGVSAFKKGINESKAAVKTFDEALKMNEAQLKATGDAEVYLENKSKILAQQMKAQQQVVKQAEAALEAMKRNGVSASSTEFQRMQQQVMQARSKLMEISASMKGAEGNARDLGTEVGKIGKGVAWDNVAEGIGKITSQLENGARAAINFGKRLINSAKGSTGLADEILTTVAKYEDMGLTADSYQRMTKVAEFIDTPVDAILNARSRMNKALAGDKGKKSLEEVLGISLEGQTSEDLFWETGEALMSMGEAFDKEAAAQTLFGRSWRELRPLFKAGREEYERMLSEQTVLTDEQIDKLGKADDAIKSVEQEIQQLKAQFWAENADTITDVLGWVVENKDSVVTALGAIGIAFGGLKITEMAANIGKVVSGLKELNLLRGVTATSTAAAAAGKAVTNATTTALTAGLGGGAAGLVAGGLTSTMGMVGSGVLLGIPLIERFTRQKTAEQKASEEAMNQMMKLNPGGLFGSSFQNTRRANELIANEITGGKPVEVPTEPKVADGAGKQIAADIGMVSVPVVLVPAMGGSTGRIRTPAGWVSPDGNHANGLPYVPFDGYMAMLHRGERVMPARENKSYTYNSNTYFGSVNLNNGLEVDSLADAIAKRNAKNRRGYGS